MSTGKLLTYLVVVIALVGLYLSLPDIEAWLKKDQAVELIKPVRKKLNISAVRYESPREVLAAVKCRGPNFVSAPKKKQAIYKWVDANGKTHFSDQAIHASAETVKEKLGSPQRFVLSITDQSNATPLDFRDQLEVRIRKNYSVVNELLPSEMVKDANVQLWMFKSRQHYEQFRRKHAPGLDGPSNGFHSGKDNIAAVFYKNDEQSMRTAIHEAAHVVNLAVLGNTPRWLNEGLAEYLERMKVYGQTVEIEPNKGWFRRLRETPMSVNQLLSSTRDDWESEQRQSLYAHSWAFVFYLLSEPETKAVLKKYLNETAKTPCETLNFARFVKTYGDLRRLNAGFSGWQPNLASAHLY